MMTDRNTPHITLPGSKRGTDPVTFDRRTVQLRAPTHTGHHPHPTHTQKKLYRRPGGLTEERSLPATFYRRYTTATTQHYCTNLGWGAAGFLGWKMSEFCSSLRAERMMRAAMGAWCFCWAMAACSRRHNTTSSSSAAARPARPARSVGEGGWGWWGGLEFF